MIRGSGLHRRNIWTKCTLQSQLVAKRWADVKTVSVESIIWVIPFDEWLMGGNKGARSNPPHYMHDEYSSESNQDKYHPMWGYLYVFGVFFSKNTNLIHCELHLYCRLLKVNSQLLVLTVMGWQYSWVSHYTFQCMPVWQLWFPLPLSRILYIMFCTKYVTSIYLHQWILLVINKAEKPRHVAHFPNID